MQIVILCSLQTDVFKTFSQLINIVLTPALRYIETFFHHSSPTSATESFKALVMGYGLNRFVGLVDQNLTCSICVGVLEKAIITPCGHSFCEKCLQIWLERPNTSTCPSCRTQITAMEMIPVLALRGMVESLTVQCDNAEHGCRMTLRLDKLKGHLQKCSHGLVQCVACGAQVKRYELPEHHEKCEVINDVATRKRNEGSGTTIEELTRQVTALEIDLKKTKSALKESETEVLRVKRDLREMQYQLELRSEEDEFDPDWDSDYSYGYSPSSIAQLASFISRYLLNKPYYVDRNRIFNAIKRCYDYYHGYAGYSQDVHMLLAASYASNWFTENQRGNFDTWLQDLARERFLPSC